MLLAKGRNKRNISESCSYEKLCLIQELGVGLDASSAGGVQRQLTSCSTSTDSAPLCFQSSLPVFGFSLVRKQKSFSWLNYLHLCCTAVRHQLGVLGVVQSEWVAQSWEWIENSTMWWWGVLQRSGSWRGRGHAGKGSDCGRPGWQGRRSAARARLAGWHPVASGEKTNDSLYKRSVKSVCPFYTPNFRMKWQLKMNGSWWWIWIRA